MQLGGPAPGLKTSLRTVGSVVLESFRYRGRRGSALVAWRTRPAIMGTYQNDKQRGCVCLFIVADGSGGMTFGQHLLVRGMLVDIKLSLGTA